MLNSGYLKHLVVLLVVTSTQYARAEEAPKRAPAHASIIPLTAPDPIKPIENTGLEFSAFFDLQFVSAKSDDAAFPERAMSGFMLEDGALFLRKKTPRLQLLMDLPIYRAKTSITGGSTSDDNNMIFAQEKAQIYGRYAMNETTDITIGQFDTIYGVEGVDSKDRIFAAMGPISNALPYSHTGMMVDWHYTEGGTLKVFAANPGSRGSLGSDSTDDNVEMGASLGYSNDTFRAQVGAISRSIRMGDKTERHNLVDAILGATFGNFAVDLELLQIRNPLKNDLTPGDTTDIEDAGRGAMLLASYKLSEANTVAVRLEKTEKHLISTDSYQVTAAAISFQHRVDENFLLRADAYSQQDKATENADAVKSSKFIVSSVFTF